MFLEIRAEGLHNVDQPVTTGIACWSDWAREPVLQGIQEIQVAINIDGSLWPVICLDPVLTAIEDAQESASQNASDLSQSIEGVNVSDEVRNDEVYELEIQDDKGDKFEAQQKNEEC